jgi:hypothetical protein
LRHARMVSQVSMSKLYACTPARGGAVLSRVVRAESRLAVAFRTHRMSGSHQILSNCGCLSGPYLPVVRFDSHRLSWWRACLP